MKPHTLRTEGRAVETRLILLKQLTACVDAAGSKGFFVVGVPLIEN